jgi:SRSO17 transposase
MTDALDEHAEDLLAAYFDRIGEVLGHKARRASFAMYAMGVLGDGARKSVEPIASRGCGDPEEADATHQRLLHFLVDSGWEDHAVRLEAAREGIEAMTAREPIRSWIVDDTGFLKQGMHSVGVQRQYTGSAGKVTNCQIGVSLTLATNTMHLPIDFELYLPRLWADDPERRAEARIPDNVVFETKPEQALKMIRRAVENHVPPGLVLGDTAYGDNVAFRRGIRALGLDYALGVSKSTFVQRCGPSLKTYGPKITVEALAARSRFRRVTWRDGTKKRLTGSFAFERVVPAYVDADFEPKHREDVWLVMEWRDAEDEPTRYHLVTLPPRTTKKQLVRAVKERYRTEQMYREMKDELGLDHYEGRRFPGWHHHVSVVIACYAFVVATRARAFPPSASWPGPLATLSNAA